MQPRVRSAYPGFKLVTSIAFALSFCACVSLLGCNEDGGSAPWVNSRIQDASDPDRARDAGVLDLDDDGGSNGSDTDDAGAEDASTRELRDADLPSDASDAELDAASDAATDGDDAGTA